MLPQLLLTVKIKLLQLLDLFYDGSSSTFDSSFGLDESIQRLASVTKKSAFSARLREVAVGQVNEQHVYLRRVRPFVANAFKPIFVGSFHQNGDRIYLTGRFVVHPIVMIFFSCWFGLLVLWT